MFEKFTGNHSPLVLVGTGELAVITKDHNKFDV